MINYSNVYVVEKIVRDYFDKKLYTVTTPERDMITVKHNYSHRVLGYILAAGWLFFIYDESDIRLAEEVISKCIQLYKYNYMEVYVK